MAGGSSPCPCCSKGHSQLSCSFPVGAEAGRESVTAQGSFLRSRCLDKQRVKSSCSPGECTMPGKGFPYLGTSDTSRAELVTQDIQSLFRLKRLNPNWSRCHPRPIGCPPCQSAAAQQFAATPRVLCSPSMLEVPRCSQSLAGIVLSQRGWHRGDVCWGRAQGSPACAGRLNPALCCEQHLLQTEEHLGLLCWLGFTLHLSVSC